MKRDMDLMHELLLRLERLPMRMGGIVQIPPDAPELQVDGYDVAQIDYHLSLIKKSGWIDSGGVNPMVGIGFRALTQAGHDLLDSSRRSRHAAIDVQTQRATTTMTSVRTSQEIERGISRLQERIEALRAFDIQALKNGVMAELAALTAAIADTLERCFGKDTTAYRRYKPATALRPLQHRSFTNDFYLREEVRENFERSIALLLDAQRALREDLEDAKHATVQPDPKEAPLSRRVFVVHGHDGEARELVARFLKSMDFEPIILHEQPNQGGTVIEKFETHSDVGFAVVLLTPDDVGRSVKEEKLNPRARQNVVLELGYFIGRLGRTKVCALKRGDVELPSDYVGIVWENMDAGGGWKLALARELKAAGHAVDLNKALEQ